MRVTPVMLPLGRLRLSTRPASTASPPRVQTIGIVAVAAFAASPDGSPPTAAITATWRATLDRPWRIWASVAVFAIVLSGFVLGVLIIPVVQGRSAGIDAYTAIC